MAGKREPCRHAKSDMTPCFRRDGDVVIVKRLGTEICVGCELGIDRLRKAMKLDLYGGDDGD